MGRDENITPRSSQDATSSSIAPEHEPEVWDATVPAFNPYLSHSPEPYPVVVSRAFAGSWKNAEEYLVQERAKDLLRFSTAGSVDDGKSTLIGRLLYDTQSVYDDQLHSIKGKGTTGLDVPDLALLTDGLRAEREQGITIDVAYKYFSTAQRKFIIADTPGHEQYTRNMATGASTADVALVLVDVRKGLLPQSRRHILIAALLGVRNIVVAVNKMDLAYFGENAFSQAEKAIRELRRDAQGINLQAVQFHLVPVSALTGDNVAHRSSQMPWYCGPTILELLEALPTLSEEASAPFRFAVQLVVRPSQDFRGFAGQVASGSVRCGDAVTILPSGARTSVKEIVTFDGVLLEATAPMSVTLRLEDEMDISRGDVICSLENPASVVSAIEAALVWLDQAPLEATKRYLLKQSTRTVPAYVKKVTSSVEVGDSRTVDVAPRESLELNEIGIVQVEMLQPTAVDLYSENRHTGSFILIDPATNATAAAGMIRRIGTSAKDFFAVTSTERTERYRHTGAHLCLSGPTEWADALERALFDRGCFVVRVPDEETSISTLMLAGALVLSQRVKNEGELALRCETDSLVKEFHLSSGVTLSDLRHVLDELEGIGILL